MSDNADLLSNVSANAGEDVIGEWKKWHGGPGDFWGWGNLGGGTLMIEATINKNLPCRVCGSEIVDINTNESGIAKFNLNNGSFVRAIIINTTSPVQNVTAKVN